MITTKYNFKKWLRRKYPDVIAEPIYGTPTYILSKELDPKDNFIYGVRQQADGRYIATVLGTEENRERAKRCIENKAPTSFKSFTEWMKRNNIQPITRIHKSHQSIRDLLFPTSAAFSELKTEERYNIPKGCTLDQLFNWYMYEITLPLDINENNDEDLLTKVPYLFNKNTNTYTVLVHASYDIGFKSKKRRFIENYKEMESLSTRIIEYCAQASFAESIGQLEKSKELWSEAQLACTQYMSIQFERDGYVQIDDLREAYNAHTIEKFIRNRDNFIVRDRKSYTDTEDDEWSAMEIM